MTSDTSAKRLAVPHIRSALRAALLWRCLVALAAGVPVSARAEPNGTQPSAPSNPKIRTLGVVLFEGFEVLDVYGPLEMWGSVGEPIKIVTLARRAGPVTSAQGARTVADFSFRGAPRLDLILVPGGPGVRSFVNDGDVLEFLRARAERAEVVMSVCNGAWILAAAGLLDGRPATTNKAYWERAAAFGPKVRWVRRARWVDDGNRVTSSGVSAGIDMSLHVIARLLGTQLAEGIANGAEYEWHRDPDRDPFAVALE
jgi:transcriptional regulator GlxA family with amidase domain